MSHLSRRALLGLLAVVSLVAALAPPAGASKPTRDYIVVFADSVQHPGFVAHAQADAAEGDMSSFFKTLGGYAVTLPTDEVADLRSNPKVDYVTIDHQVSVQEEVKIDTKTNGGIEVFEATLPTGIQRSYASANKALSIDGVDNLRANVDVAVIDTGIDFAHPDLNVVTRTSCVTGTCIDGSGTDVYTHGTHVAGTIGAIDNGIGVVGVAPGARMWAVKSLGDGGSGQESWIIKGVEWVTAHAGEIEVANMSLGCECPLTALEEAIGKSVKAGVVYAIAAGNSSSDAKFFSPAKYEGAITVSALADYDGKPGGKSASTCTNYGLDDRSASFSNYGTIVDIAAPGVCILSTAPGSKYGLKSGTSMATPLVAGAAAVLAGQNNPNSEADVKAIRNTLVAAGNFEWTDSSPDGVKEPLLDLSNEATFKLASLPENTALPVPSPATPLQAVPETTTTGTWTGSPTSYAYQWQRCNAAGSECVNIAGATKSSYTPIEGDVEKTLVVKVTATTPAGSASAFSKATGKVIPIGQITEYPAKAGAKWIEAGPDGNLWYTTSASPAKINKITTAGTVTEYLSPFKESQFGQIVAGPDGNMWFAEYRGNTGTSPAHIGKITMAGAVTEYALPNGSQPTGLTVGPDGKIWFTAKRSNKIGKITTAGAITEYALPASTEPESITVGPDNNLWFTEPCGGLFGCNGKIGKITTAGAITEYTLPTGPAGPVGITVGPDGNLWFTEYTVNKIGKMTTAGVLLAEYNLPAGSRPYDVAKAPDGNLWFTNWESSKIGRITTSGAITEYALPANSRPQGITVGPDLNVWFAGAWSSKVGKIAP
jgi:streptogramin lyase/subtilisin family serine protease